MKGLVVSNLRRNGGGRVGRVDAFAPMEPVRAVRRSTLYLVGTSLLVLTVLCLALHAGRSRRFAESSMKAKGALVRELDLTDLCLCTEASYTRNPALTDLSTPFQDAPLSLEHFPSGALLGLPPHLVKADGTDL